MYVWDMRVRHVRGNMRVALTLLDFLFWSGDIHNTTWTYDSTVYTDIKYYQEKLFVKILEN